MLAESKKAGLTIHEVEIDTVYLNGNKSSHFQPIRSSLQIYKVFLKFTASFGLDMGLFALFIWTWRDDVPQMYIFLATIIARVISASFNYSINRKKVFEEGDEKSFLK